MNGSKLNALVFSIVVVSLLIFPMVVEAANGDLKWYYTTGGDIYASPAIASDGTICFGSYDEFFYALNMDGSLKWKYYTDLPIASSAAVAENGTIYFGTNIDDALYALNADGSYKWKTILFGWNICSIRSSPGIGPDGTIYVGEGCKGVYWINPTNGEKTCVHNTNYVDVYASPAITPQNTFYIGDRVGKVHSLGPGCRHNWKVDLGDPGNNIFYGVYSSPAIAADGTILFATFDRSSSSKGKLFAVNPDSTIQWTFSSNDEFHSSPAIGTDGTIYIGCDDNKLYAINSNGTLKWTFTTGGNIESSPAIGADGTIFVGSCDYKLYAIRSDGTLKWSYETGGEICSSPNIDADGTVYIGSYDDKLYAIEDDSGGLAVSPWPMFRHDERHTGLYVEYIDSDDDGIWDIIEDKNCTDKSDADTDDDGIIDGNEDKDHDGVLGIDDGETDPCKPDTDNDGILDGTEIGLTEPQNAAATNLAKENFKADADNSTQTNPKDPDTDGDGILDGEEDINSNGRVDPGETDPNERDVRALPFIPLLFLNE